MTGAEQQAMRDAIAEAVRRGHDEGIKTAAEAVRMSVNSSRLMDLLRRDPAAGLNAIADVLDQTLPLSAR